MGDIMYVAPPATVSAITSVIASHALAGTCAALMPASRLNFSMRGKVVPDH